METKISIEEPRATVPKLLDAYVTDLAGILPPAHKARLRQELYLLHRDKGAYCSLLTVESLARYGWARKQADLFAKRAFQAGCLDGKGLLIVVAKKERIARVRFGEEVLVQKGRAVKRIMMVDFPLDWAKAPVGNALGRAVERSIDVLAPQRTFDYPHILVAALSFIIVFAVLLTSGGWRRVFYVTATIVGIPLLCVASALVCIHYEWESGIYFCIIFFVLTYEYMRVKMKERYEFVSLVDIPLFLLELLFRRRRWWSP